MSFCNFFLLSIFEKWDDLYNFAVSIENGNKQNFDLFYIFIHLRTNK